MCNQNSKVDPELLAIHASIAINQVIAKLRSDHVPREHYRDALVMQAFLLGLQYPGCMLDPFVDSRHKYRDELARSFRLGTGTADQTVPTYAVVH